MGGQQEQVRLPIRDFLPPLDPVRQFAGGKQPQLIEPGLPGGKAKRHLSRCSAKAFLQIQKEMEHSSCGNRRSPSGFFLCQGKEAVLPVENQIDGGNSIRMVKAHAGVLCAALGGFQVHVKECFHHRNAAAGYNTILA